MSESIGNSGAGMKLHTKILLGLLVGAAVGVTLNLTLGGTHPTVVGLNKYLAGPVGQIFLRLLFMIVIPLVFASIALGVAGLGDIRRVGRVGGKAIGYFLGTTALSATLGLILVSIVRPGERLDPATRVRLLATYASDATSKVEAAATSTFGIETLVNVVPRNPFKSAVDLDMLGIIFFGIMFGAALTLIAAERAKPMLAVLEALQDVVIKIVEIAMRLAPFGVAALIFGVTSRFGFDLLVPLAWYVALVLGSLLLHVLLTISGILRFVVGISPALFFSRIRSALITAFSTSSSSATLPTALATAEQNLGIPPQIAGFVLPLGSTMCMNGTALFEGITVIFLCQVFGIDLSLVQMVIVMVMSVITAVGAAGVPGGSIPLLVGILAMFRVPGEGIAIVLGVDRILDMSRTTVNVCGDLSATAYVARSEGIWSAAMVPAVAGVVDRKAPLDDSPGWPPSDSVDATDRERGEPVHRG
jgi:dicarboxylate/amino acid:cation (Na+ or H+) symporter, DAACS family